jgi:hypothetical protein
MKPFKNPLFTFAYLNRMKKYTPTVILLSILFCIGWSCSCDRENIPNPCKDILSTTADFNSFEGTTVFGFSFDGDPYNILLPVSTAQTNFLSTELVQFDAIEKDAKKYEWYVGVRSYTGNTLSLRFKNDKTSLEAWDIRLKINKPKKIYTCFEGDDSIKIVTKRIYIHQLPVYFGTWRGVNSDKLKDTFEIKIGIRKQYTLKDINYQSFCTIVDKVCSDTALINNYNLDYMTYTRFVSGASLYGIKCDTVPYRFYGIVKNDSIDILQHLAYRGNLVKTIHFKGIKISNSY